MLVVDHIVALATFVLGEIVKQIKCRGFLREMLP